MISLRTKTSSAERKVNMQIYLKTLALILAASATCVLQAEADNIRETKPALKIPDKPSEQQQRTQIKPGKPESDQPPPDAVGTTVDTTKSADQTRKALDQTTTPAASTKPASKSLSKQLKKAKPKHNSRAMLH